MTAKPYVIEARKDGGEWVLVGDTYAFRSLLARAGCRYDKASKTWRYVGESLPPRVATIISPRTAQVQQPLPLPAPASAPQIVVMQVSRRVKPRRQWRAYRRPAHGAPRKDKAPRPAPDAPSGFVKPSYWDDLVQYLTPGAARPAVALVGPTGNGKTTAAEAAMQAMSIPYIVIDATEFTEVADLVGYMTFAQRAESGQPVAGEVWVDGKVTRAFREGRGVIINEFDALNPRVAMCLQSAFQSGKARYVTLPNHPSEDRVYPAGDCPILLTMNTYGSGATRQYVGRNTLDAASMDRITILPTGYENELSILVAHGYTRAVAEPVVNWAQGMRTTIDRSGLNVSLSMRTLLNIVQAVQVYGKPHSAAMESEFWRRLPAETANILRRK